MSSQMSVEKAHEPKDLDVTAARRGVWLVKVPKYLSEKWHKATGTCDVGKLRISQPRFPGSKPEVLFTLAEQPDEKNTTGVHCPKDHKFVLTGTGSQNLIVMSQTPVIDQETSEPTELLALEGKIIQRAECQPIADANYLKLKRLHWAQSNKPAREIKQIETVINKFKPVADHQFNLEDKQRKKEEGKKQRANRDQVKDMLFNAFEKHQYYFMKDLERITQQPTVYLKEILKEICTYNLKAPHRNTWELKEEYCYYKKHEEEASGSK